MTRTPRQKQRKNNSEVFPISLLGSATTTQPLQSLSEVVMQAEPFGIQKIQGMRHVEPIMAYNIPQEYHAVLNAGRHGLQTSPLSAYRQPFRASLNELDATLIKLQIKQPTKKIKAFTDAVDSYVVERSPLSHMAMIGSVVNLVMPHYFMQLGSKNTSRDVYYHMKHAMGGLVEPWQLWRKDYKLPSNQLDTSKL